MDSLDEIALRYGTDKSSDGHNYCVTYDKWFAFLRHEDITLVELGVWEGSSLLMWADYFESARIIGVDVDLSRVRQDVRDHPRIELIELNTDNLRWGSNDFVDILIDDASHLEAPTTNAINNLAEGVKFFYCIEDLHTFYWPHANAPGAAQRLLGPRVDAVLGLGQELRSTPWALHLYSSLVIFERDAVLEPIPTFSS